MARTHVHAEQGMMRIRIPSIIVLIPDSLSAFEDKLDQRRVEIHLSSLLPQILSKVLPECIVL